MITVQLLQPTDYHISLFGDPLNRVFLDTDEDFGIRLTKALEQLSEVEQITQEAALSVAIDSTDKNKTMLLRWYFYEVFKKYKIITPAY